MVGIPMVIGGPNAAPLAVPPVSGFTMFMDPATNVMASGKVSQWKDRSGSARHFDQSTDAAKPSLLIEAAPFGGTKPALVFDGLDDRMIDAGFTLSDLITTTDFTLYAVAGPMRAGTNDTATTPGGKELIIGSNGGYMSLSVGATKIFFQVYTTAYVAVSDTFTPGTAYGIECRQESGTLYLRLSGGTEVSATGGTLGALTGDVYVGQAPATASLYLPAMMGTIVTYASALSSGDRTSMRSWIATEYPGITW